MPRPTVVHVTNPLGGRIPSRAALQDGRTARQPILGQRRCLGHLAPASKPHPGRFVVGGEGGEGVEVGEGGEGEEVVVREDSDGRVDDVVLDHPVPLDAAAELGDAVGGPGEDAGDGQGQRVARRLHRAMKGGGVDGGGHAEVGMVETAIVV